MRSIPCRRAAPNSRRRPLFSKPRPQPRRNNRYSVRSRFLQWLARDRRGTDRPDAIAFRGKVFRRSSRAGLAWEKAKDLRRARRARRGRVKGSGRAKGEATFRRLGEATPALNRNVLREPAGAVR